MQKVGLWRDSLFIQCGNNQSLLAQLRYIASVTIAQGKVGGRLAIYFPALTNKCQAARLSHSTSLYGFEPRTGQQLTTDFTNQPNP
jgi:hypothetical protein